MFDWLEGSCSIVFWEVTFGTGSQYERPFLLVLLLSILFSFCVNSVYIWEGLACNVAWSYKHHWVRKGVVPTEYCLAPFLIYAVTCRQFFSGTFHTNKGNIHNFLHTTKKITRKSVLDRFVNYHKKVLPKICLFLRIFEFWNCINKKLAKNWTKSTIRKLKICMILPATFMFNFQKCFSKFLGNYDFFICNIYIFFKFTLLP